MRSLLYRVARTYLNYIYHDAVRLRFQAQMDSLDGIGASTFLDCGCHTGRNTLNAAALLSPKMTIGIEYGTSLIPMAQERGINVIQSDLNRPIPLCSESVDVVTAFDVLEHLVETWPFVTELYRILVPGGHLVIDSPNLASWHNVFALVLGIQPFSGPNLISLHESEVDLVRSMHRNDHGFSDGDEVELTDSDRKMHRHIVVVAYRSLINVLKQAGFVIQGTRSFGYYPFPPLLAPIFCRLDPAHAHHYVIKARKPALRPMGRGRTEGDNFGENAN
jgi:SAM-dependent methyltransferase